MRKTESLYPEDWFKVGAKELRRAENLLNLSRAVVEQQQEDDIL